LFLPDRNIFLSLLAIRKRAETLMVEFPENSSFARASNTHCDPT
jgi:hypothetical protein